MAFYEVSVIAQHRFDAVLYHNYFDKEEEAQAEGQRALDDWKKWEGPEWERYLRLEIKRRRYEDE
jgi:hypothetical protein